METPLKENIVLSDYEVFKAILTKPRLGFRYILEKNYANYFYTILCLAGMSSALNSYVTEEKIYSSSLYYVLPINLLLSGLLGWIFLYIYAALMSWTGSWLGGKGNTDTIYKTIAYASITSVLSIALNLILLFYLKFTTTYDGETIYFANDFGIYIYYALIGIVGLASIYSFVLLIIGISEVQKLPIGESILNIFLPALLFMIPIIIIILLTSL
jgi:hypothetical protein